MVQAVQEKITKNNPMNNILDLRRQDFLKNKSFSPNRPNAYIKPPQILTLLDKLLEEREQIMVRRKEQEKIFLDKNELLDPVDEASINIQASHELRIRNRENFYLKKINLSLDKILKDSYGLCSECDNEISIERLLARPTAEMCICCKEEAELGEKNNIFGKKSKSFGHSLVEISSR